MQRERESWVHRWDWSLVGIKRSEVRYLTCIVISFIDLFSSRNLAERCPGEQTNNRAELIVRFFVFSCASLTGTLQGNPASPGNRPSFQKAFDDSNGFPVLYELSALLQIYDSNLLFTHP
jgi:hypothetical protein